MSGDEVRRSRSRFRVGQHGWVGVDLRRVDPEEMAELLDEAWRATAPKRVVAAYDGSR